MLANISANNMSGSVDRATWRVCYFRSVHNTGLKEFSLPLHPDDVLDIQMNRKKLNESEVQFEIVKMWLYGKMIFVAKLK